MKIRAIYLYLIFITWAGFLVSLLKFTSFNHTSLGITLAFLTLVIAPGVFLERLINKKAQEFSLRILYILGFGFSYHFLISLLGLLSNFTLDQVIFFDLFGIILIFLISLIRDRELIWECHIKAWLKEQTLSDWALSVFLFGGTLMAFLGVNAQLAAGGGDAGFHLAILNKIFSLANLDSYNIWPVKTTTLNLVYSFPLWHILLAWFAKFINISIFTIFNQIVLPLSIIVMLVWWGFSKTIFPNRYFASIIFLAFLTYFFSAGFFYTLIPVKSPDSLNRLLLFPLLLALTMAYLFRKDAKIWSNVILLAVLSIFIGLIHFTQLIEYVLILIVFIILFLIVNRQKEVMKKTAWLLLVLGGGISLYLGIFQAEGIKQFLLTNAHNFTEDNFRNKSLRYANIFYLNPVFALPFMVLFIKKQSRFIFLISIPLTLALITWEVFHLRPLFLKYLGEIFTIRAITDISGFVFWGFLLLLLILGLNYLFSRLKRIYAYIFYGLLAVIFLLEVFVSAFRNFFWQYIDETFLTGGNLFVNTYFWWIMLILILLAIGIYLHAHYYLKSDLSLDAPKNTANFVILTIAFFLMFTWPYQRDYWSKITESKKSIFIPSEIKYFGDIHIIGREKTVDFIKSVPSETVLATSNTDIVQVALLYCRCYAAEYPYGVNKFNYSLALFDPSSTPEKRQGILNEYSIDYIITLNPAEEKLFSEYPASFTQVFENSFQYPVESKKKGIYQKQVDLKIYQYNP